jgi:hypothetical protein
MTVLNGKHHSYFVTEATVTEMPDIQAGGGYVSVWKFGICDCKFSDVSHEQNSDCN